MNLHDLAKKTIDEVSKEELHEEVENKIALAKEQEESKLEETQLDEPEVIDFNAYEKEINELIEKKSEENKEPQVLINDKQDEFAGLSFNEEVFLKNIRERVLVLFEGLSSSDEKDLRSRLDLTINFLEFLLANIEDKLKK
ncbi:2-oxoglutarate:acceptor oxidoreductase [Campylobacter sp. MIT 12-8780]|uniref:CiaD-like domain-containing protein n=1 Tax=unclassified Campylobacter TaxID=2593542 RepID=UPI00115E968E|nr:MULTISPECIES: 2-oxoglutarate:acceptor oxidoreductase [unclassified Campylobacter]NDJ26926.1 OCTOPUS family protein [Campylobacter sp. MIT 19-121]TQR41930.1 2-oxoglutarate:acceptor oxidoreductase [Campylobacter sp. MIT 12-8780]